MARASQLPEQSASEIAAQKAARSAAYRGSQTFRNLLIALGVTLVIVVVVMWGVPRGTPATQPEIDVDAVAADTADAYGTAPLVADLSDEWGVNLAQVVQDQIVTWKVVYLAPDERNYVTLLQGFDGDEAWATQQLDGAAPAETTTIDGVEWNVYEIGTAQEDAGYTYAIGTPLGDGYAILKGSASAEVTADLAGMLAGQIKADPPGPTTEGDAQ